MARYVAFLRAINVGGHTVKMEKLRALFGELGLADVSTFIASGNVIFESRARDVAALERKIEAHLEKALGYEVACFVRSTRELAEIAERNPFGDAESEEGSLYVLFLRSPPEKDAVEQLTAFRTEVDDFRVHGRELYWRCLIRMSDSTFGTAIGKTIRTPGTMRNATTLRKLAALHPAPK